MDIMMFWSVEAVRNFCVRHCFYSEGTAWSYGDMLRRVRKNRPTLQLIGDVASDIWNHSSKSIQGSYSIIDIMNMMMDENVVRVIFVRGC